MSTIDPYALTTHGGKTVDQLTHHALLEAERRLGYELTITQGSYNAGKVSASAGTHDGGGVVDLAPFDWRNKVRVLREVGFAAWFRPALRDVWPSHIHAVLIGNKKLSPSAMRQVLDFQRGLNGLANHADDPDDFRPGVVFEMPKPVERPLVERNRTRVAAVNMHAPGANDAARMEAALDRFRHLGITLVALSEFNAAMAEVVKASEHWGLHRAKPNSGTSGNAVLYWRPVWRFVAGDNLPVQLTTRRLTMAGAWFEHKRTGLRLPVLAVHNPPRFGKAAMPPEARATCLDAELDWALDASDTHGRSLVMGDLNQPGTMLVPMRRGVANGVDHIYGHGVTFSKPLVHPGFDPTITDHKAVSVLINVEES